MRFSNQTHLRKNHQSLPSRTHVSRCGVLIRMPLYSYSMVVCTSQLSLLHMTLSTETAFQKPILMDPANSARVDVALLPGLKYSYADFTSP